MKQSNVTLIALGLCLGPLSALAAPDVNVTSRADTTFPDCGTNGDALTMTVSDGGREIAKLDYCSAYGRGSAQVVADQAGRTYVAVDYGEGHGTNATTEYVVIYRLIGSVLNEVVRVPLSWATGTSGRWTYTYAIEPSLLGGLQVMFRRLGNGEGDECCVLPERTLVLTLDAQ